MNRAIVAAQGVFGTLTCRFNGFGGVLSMDSPRTAELSSLTRVVSMRRQMVFRKLPEKATPAGIGGRPLVAGVPLASDCGVERVLFAVVNPGASG